MIKWFKEENDTIKAYARGVAGGLLFGTPLLFTMEMWWLGFSLSPLQLLIAVVANFLILLILERFSGFREDTSFLEEVQDAIVAQGLGFIVSIIILGLINQLRPDMSPGELIGKIIMQTIAISIGVSVAMGLLGQGDEEKQQDRQKTDVGFWGNQGEAVAGAVFFALNIAATEEPMMIGLQMRPIQSLLLLLLTIILVFAITYALEFRGGIKRREETRWYTVIWKDSVSTCTTALLIAAGALFLFGRIDLETGLLAGTQMVIALGFATSLGAAAARLLI